MNRLARSVTTPFPHRVRHRSHALLLFSAGILAWLLAVGLNWAWPEFLEPVELWTVDLRFRVRPPLPVSADPHRPLSDAIALIDYDDQAARDYRLGRWPWDRRVHAQVLDWLHQAGAQTVVMDFLMDRPASQAVEDRALVASTARAKTVFYAVLIEPTRERVSRAAVPVSSERHLLQSPVTGDGNLPGSAEIVWPLPDLIATAAGLGHIQRTLDRDGVLRRIPLVYTTPKGLMPALSLAAAFHHLGADPASVQITLGDALTFTTRDGSRVRIPLDAQGLAWINYAGPWGKRFEHFLYSWLRAQMDSPDGRAQLSEWFRGKTVVLNNLTTGSGDQGPIPFERDFPFGEVHAHLANMFLTNQFLRDATRSETFSALGLPILILTAVALAGGPSLIVPVYAIILVSSLLVLQHLFSHHGIIVPAVIPTLALTFGLVLFLTVRFFFVDRERRRFLSALGAVLPPHTIGEIQQSPGLIPHLLTGRRRELAILYVDMQDFSPFCQKADPLEIQRVLREYRTSLTDILRAHGGTLDKYTGDEIMAFFGDADPDGGDDDRERVRVERRAANAVRAGLAIQRAMWELNETWRREGRATHDVRVGITTGPVTIGNFGTDTLWQYGIVGSEVNKGKRLEGAAPPGGILLSRRTYSLACNQKVVPADLAPVNVPLRGFEGDEEIYAIPREMALQLTAQSTGARPESKPSSSSSAN
jgi:adenylate cyclase